MNAEIYDRGISFACVQEKVLHGRQSEEMNPIAIGVHLCGVDGAIRSRQEEFTAILSSYSPVLYRIALRKVGNAEDAEDVLQEAFLSAFKSLHQFKGRAQLSTWLTSIVLNSARMQLRRRLNHDVSSIDEGQTEGQPLWGERLQHPAPNAEDDVCRIEMRKTLERLAEKLPSQFSSAFRLCIFEALPISEAAAALGIPKGTLKARLFRARKLMTILVRKAFNPPAKAGFKTHAQSPRKS